MEFAINSIYTARKSFPKYQQGQHAGSENRPYYIKVNEKFKIIAKKNGLYRCYSLELGHPEHSWFEVTGEELDYILRVGETK